MVGGVLRVNTSTRVEQPRTVSGAEECRGLPSSAE